MFKNILVLKFLAIFLLTLMLTSCSSDEDVNDALVATETETVPKVDTDVESVPKVDTDIEVLIDNVSEAEKVKDSNFLSKYWLEAFVILVLGLFLLVVIITSLFHIEKKGTFYSLKRKTPKKKQVPVSNPTSKEPELKILNSDVEGNISYQTESIKNLKNDVSNLMISIKDMNDTFMTLKANLDQKDEEISRLKDGYDSTIFRGFILRFTRVDKVLKENLKDKKYSLDALEDIQIQMEDALAECSIEIFSPALGADFKTSEGVADNPKQIDTTDKNKNLTIAEVIQPGYRRRLPNSNDDDFQIITEAKVAIYIYKD